MTSDLSELRILLMLATDSPKGVAYKLADGQGPMNAHTVRAWMHRLAADLDAAGYNGDALRALLWSDRRPRMTLFSDLEGEDRQAARRRLSAAELDPAPCDPVKARRSFRNLVFAKDAQSCYGQPRAVHEEGLWRVRDLYWWLDS